MIEVELPEKSNNNASLDYIMIEGVALNENYRKFFNKLNSPTYLPWSKVKYKNLEGFSSEETWEFLRRNRFFKKEILPIVNEKKQNFWYCKLPRFEKFLHEFDKLAGGKKELHSTKNLIQKGLMNEAIDSSRIEGATTTRKAAKKLLRERITPKTKSEQMLLNNYETMQQIKSEWKNEEMSQDLLFKIHFNLTQKTDVSEKDFYRFRKNQDEINVVDNVSGEIAHIPPDEKFLNTEISRFIDFANNKTDDEENFLHPLVKAIILHFWIGYLHPFTDGNGRTARGIFYWYLLRNGYWAIPFLPISSKIIESQKQYRDAYLYSEQIDNDFTYFLDYNIKQIGLAITDFYENLAKIEKDKEEENKLLGEFNERQARLIQYFAKNPHERTSFKIHQSFHGISLLTARADLLDLEKKGKISRKKIGKTVWFNLSHKSL